MAVIDTALPSAITDDYEVGHTLGSGHFSKVKLGTNRTTGEKVAIKVCGARYCASVLALTTHPHTQIINKPTGNKIAMLKAEVNILTKCDHPNMCENNAKSRQPRTLSNSNTPW